MRDIRAVQPEGIRECRRRFLETHPVLQLVGNGLDRVPLEHIFMYIRKSAESQSAGSLDAGCTSLFGGGGMAGDPYHEKNDHAFIPTRLPVSLSIREKLWRLRADSRGELGKLDGLCRMLPNPRLLLGPWQRREALRSSSLEETYATPQGLVLFGFEGGERNGKESEGSWAEVHNYFVALHQGTERLRKGNPPDHEFIKQFHATLLRAYAGRMSNRVRFVTTRFMWGRNDDMSRLHQWN